MPDIAVQTFWSPFVPATYQKNQPASVEAVLTIMCKDYDLNPHFRDEWEYEAMKYMHLHAYIISIYRAYVIHDILEIKLH